MKTGGNWAKVGKRKERQRETKLEECMIVKREEDLLDLWRRLLWEGCECVKRHNSRWKEVGREWRSGRAWLVGGMNGNENEETRENEQVDRGNAVLKSVWNGRPAAPGTFNLDQDM